MYRFFKLTWFLHKNNHLPDYTNSTSETYQQEAGTDILGKPKRKKKKRLLYQELWNRKTIEI